MAGVLDALLEGFSPGAPQDPQEWGGRFTAGDKVRVSVRGGESIVGHLRRASLANPKTHVVVAPEGGAPHVEAEIGQVRLDSPAQHAQAQRRAQAAAQRPREPVPVAVVGKDAAKPAASVRESAGLLLLEDFNPSQPRGFHGRWVRVGDHHELRIFHGSTHLGNVTAGERTQMMIGVGKVVGGAGRTISTSDIGTAVDRALRQMGPEGPRKPTGSLRPREPKWQAGDLVMHSHSFLGPQPARVTKVAAGRVHIAHDDPKLRPTSMTLNQAAGKLRHQNLDEAREFARQRQRIGEYQSRRPVIQQMEAGRRAQAERDEILRKSPGAAQDLADYNAVSSSSRQRGLDQIERERRQRVPRPRVRESALDALLAEAFAMPTANPPETPAQSQVRGAAQVAAAQKSLSSGWNAAKHPRGRGGKFGYTTGGKRATRGHARRGSASSPRTLNSGSRGALVKSIQRTLNVPQDGIYGPQTKAAVARYQRQHGLQADGVVGRQTLASLRGSTNARLVAPGPITSRQARLTSRKPTAKKPAKPPAPLRVGGGAVV